MAESCPRLYVEVDPEPVECEWPAGHPGRHGATIEVELDVPVALLGQVKRAQRVSRIRVEWEGS